MERIVDKLIVLACCAGPLALVGTSRASVCMMLLAMTCSFLAELLPARVSVAPAAACCLVALALPEGSVFTALAAYDLARSSPALSALAALPVFAAGWSGALAPGAVVSSLLVCASAAALSLRADRALADRAGNLRYADELRERELALEARNRELLDAQDYEVRLATLSERARIAREIHDNVGHLLTRAVVQTEALRVVHAGEPVEGDLEAVGSTVREALDEVRTSVHDLRDDASDLSVQVRAVVERACEGTSLTPLVEVEAGEVPAAVASCLLAVVREAVSNVLRHSGAAHVSVQLAEHPGLWRLTVADDGAPVARDEVSGASRGFDGPGMGLASMEERVRALGGTFRAGPSEDGGWVVFASVPRRAEEGGAS